MSRLQDMEARRAAATPGPWYAGRWFAMRGEDPARGVVLGAMDLFPTTDENALPIVIIDQAVRADADLLANAHADLDDLLRVARLAATVFGRDSRATVVVTDRDVAGDLHALRSAVLELTAGEPAELTAGEQP